MNESFGQEYDHDVGTSREEPEPRRLLPHSQWRVYALAMVFIIAAGASYRYVSSERQQKHDLAAANQRLASSVAQLQKELHSMSNQLSELQASFDVSVSSSMVNKYVELAESPAPNV